MPLIPKAPAPPDKESIPVRLDRALHAQLRDYAEFVQGTKDYVITGALQRLFKGDREFAEWQETRTRRSEPTSPRRAGSETSANVSAPPLSATTPSAAHPTVTPAATPKPTRERA